LLRDDDRLQAAFSQQVAEIADARLDAGDRKADGQQIEPGERPNIWQMRVSE
jgi:hypothetical protein